MPPAAPAAAQPKRGGEPSPALSLVAKAHETLQTRIVGCLVSDGADAGVVDGLRKAVEAAGAQLRIIAPKAGGVAELTKESAAVDFVRDAFGHLKVIGFTAAARPLLARAGIEVSEADRGLVAIDGPRGDAAFVSQAKKGRVWEREPHVRTVF